MKKFSDLIKENNETKRFKFKANLTIEGFVDTDNEGMVGELVDKEIDEMTQFVTNVTNYTVESIDEVSNINEENEVSVLNEDPEVQIDKEIKDIFDLVESRINKYTDYEQKLFKAKLSEKFN